MLVSAPAGGPQRRAHHAFQKRPGARAGVQRRAHLAENLRFAQDQRFQAAADAEQVGGRLVAGQTGRHVAQLRLARAERFRERRTDGLIVTRHTRAPVDFRPVAGLQDDRLDAAPGEITVQARCGFAFDRKVLQAGQAGRLVVDGKRPQGGDTAVRRDRMEVHVGRLSGADAEVRALGGIRHNARRLA
jgi:hypothetical protein